MSIAAGLEYDRLFIGGEWLPSAGVETIDVVNPATEEVVGRTPHANEADVDRAVSGGARGVRPWRLAATRGR